MKSPKGPRFTSKTYAQEGSEKVVFFFTSFGTKIWTFRLIYRKLNKLGYTVVVYEFPGRELLYVDGDYLSEIGNLIQADVTAKILHYKAKTYNEFAIFGVSMGSVFGIAIAKQTPEVERLVLVTAYASCAQQIWENRLLKKMKKIYTDQGLGMQETWELHPQIEPLVNVGKLSGKHTLLYFSEDDKTILPSNTKMLIEAAKASKLDLNVVTGRGGHWRFILHTLLFNHQWERFLR